MLVRQRLIATVTVTVVAILGAACTDSDSGTSPESDVASTSSPAPLPDATAAKFAARGGIYQAYVVDAPPATDLEIFDGDGAEVGAGTTDRFGSLMFRGLEPGDGFHVRTAGDAPAATEPFRVLSPDDPPDPALYDQPLRAGLNYVEMRDGIELAMTVRLPSGKTLDDGPFPTVIEYSGYAVAAPGSLIDNILNGGTDPLAPATGTAVGSLITPLLGFATVSVQMRGSGCSGGDMDLFDYPTTYDGYDAVEIVAAQPWAKFHKVGMVGISFSGITQLFTAGTRPPSLAAIAALSVVNDLYESPGYPGGIVNSGFAATWVAERESDAEPAPDGGQAYAIELVKQGDEHCTANQKLRLQTRDPDDILGTDPFRDPALFDHRAPQRWAENIDVPVFIVGAFQDEQTGGAWPRVVAALAENPRVWATMLNGTHVDSLGPATIGRWVEFLSIYVAQTAPAAPDAVIELAPLLYNLVASAPSQAIPAIRYGDLPLEEARAKFETDPRVRVLFDNGGSPEQIGSLDPQREQTFDAWPPSEADASEWYLSPEGVLTDGSTSAPAGSSESYTSDPNARPADSLPDGQDPWWAEPAYDWAPVSEGNGVGFSSAPLSEAMTVVGTASADLYVRSSAEDTDLQVTISEVRSNGEEMFVQSGWIRASRRALDDSTSTATDPRPTYLADDANPLPSGEFSLVRVPIFPFAHTFRAGTRVRVTIQAPGGERPIWTFATIEDGSTTNTIGLGDETASRIVLPVVPAEATGPLPPCPSNRGQPCRRYTAATNGG